MMRRKSISYVLESQNMKFYSDTVIKCIIFATFVISILQNPCPTYAGIPSEAVDIGFAKYLADHEQTEYSPIHGHLGAEINYAEGNLNNNPYRGGVGLLYHIEYDDWVYASDIGGIEAGVWLWQTPNHMQKLGVSVQYLPPRRAHDNIVGRQASADGVIKFQWRTPERYYIYMDYHHDIGDVGNGGGVNLLLSRNIIFRQALYNHDCMLVPGIAVNWSSAQRVDYNFGVRPEEATSDQPAYTGRETFNGMARLTGFYIINRSWTAFAGVQANVFGPGITDSPIVTRQVTSRGYIGAAWMF